MSSKQKPERKAPAESATMFPVGTRMQGKDGMYEIHENKNGVHRWVLLKDTKLVTEKSDTELPEPEPVVVAEVAKAAEPEPEPHAAEPHKAKAVAKPRHARHDSVSEVAEATVAVTAAHTVHVRRAPKVSSKDLEEGTQMKGEDGKMYMVGLAKNQVKRWLLVKAA